MLMIYGVCTLYRVTMVVSDYILLTTLPVPKCSAISAQAGSGDQQIEEQPNYSQQILVSDHHGRHPV